MNILIVLGHPEANSFNHAIADVCLKKTKENGHCVIFHDLYEEKFNPILEREEIPKNGPIDDLVARHCKDLMNCDGIVVIHPNWWGQPPAILKGWIDRIFRPGVAYEFKEGDRGEGIPIGLLKAKVGMVFNTSNTGETRENETFKDPLETLWKNCILGLCGIKQFDRRMFRIMVTSNSEQRALWLAEVEALVDNHFPKV